MELARKPGQMASQPPAESGKSRPAPDHPVKAERKQAPRTSRRRHSHHSHHTRSLKIINLLMGVALSVVFLGWIKTWVDLEAMEREHFDTSFKLRRTSQELEQLRQHTAGLEQKMDMLVHQRLPHLRELVFDTTLPIHEGIVRDITFRRTGLGGESNYEYSVLLENTGHDPLIPNLRIVLFDETGVQTAGARVSHKDATTHPTQEFLEPFEVRAYSAILPSDRKQPPRYFQIFTD